MGIHTGQVEDIYNISTSATVSMINEGIKSEIVINDNEDLILRTSVGNDSKLKRSEEIMNIINDNIDVFKEIDKLVLNNGAITLNLIRDLHMIFTKTARFSKVGQQMTLLRRGRWKIFPNYVRMHTGIKFFVRPSLVEQYLEWTISEIDRLEGMHVDPLVIAAFVHLSFIHIHPFEDTNGRTCRALVGFILQRHGLLPFTVSPDKKGEYIMALDSSQTSKDLGPFIEYIKIQQVTYLEGLENDTVDAIIKDY
jgi:Fic family protein